MGNMFGLVKVDQSTVAVKERFGKFTGIVGPGCHCIPWCCGINIAGRLSLRVQQLDVRCETKTKVHISLAESKLSGLSMVFFFFLGSIPFSLNAVV
jgi:hypothetical protein